MIFHHPLKVFDTLLCQVLSFCKVWLVKHGWYNVTLSYRRFLDFLFSYGNINSNWQVLVLFFPQEARRRGFFIDTRFLRRFFKCWVQGEIHLSRGRNALSDSSLNSSQWSTAKWNVVLWIMGECDPSSSILQKRLL